MKVTTGRGDKGETSLLDGSTVTKDSNIINLIGKIDELQSLMGVASFYSTDEVKEILLSIEKQLYKDVMGRIAKREDISDEAISSLEETLRSVEEKIETINKFVLPYGTSSFIHMARAKAREVERYVVAEKIFPNALIYFNRLSDVLFLLALIDAKSKGELLLQ